MAQNKRGRTPTGSRLNAFYIVLGLVAIAGVGALAFAMMRSGGGAATAPIPVEGLDNPQALVARATGIVRGSADAPVKILEFADYQCPACGVFSAQVEPRLRAAYIDPGKVQFVYYDFPLTSIHQHAFLAARAGRCANEQNKFWEYHDIIFGRQSEWSAKGRANDSFSEYAGLAGLDRRAFEACLNSDKYADVVSANYRLGEQLGVNSTPTLIINGRRVGNPLNYEEIKALIDQELGT